MCFIRSPSESFCSDYYEYYFSKLVHRQWWTKHTDYILKRQYRYLVSKITKEVKVEVKVFNFHLSRIKSN